MQSCELDSRLLLETEKKRFWKSLTKVCPENLNLSEKFEEKSAPVG